MLNDYFKSVDEYCDFYSLKFDGAEHRFIEFKSGDFDLIGQTFLPKEYKATVILIHGYLNHTGLLSKIIKHLLDCGFAVAVFDLPGHGISSGEQTAIDDFAQYSTALNDFLKILKPHANGPYHVIGHSTGAAVVVDYLLDTPFDDCFEKVILAGPLERSVWWGWEKIGYLIGRHFLKGIRRVFRKVSSDRQYLDFLEYKDPIHPTGISFKWVAAMFRWDEKIHAAKNSDRSILVLQGTKDNIVDWRYNVKFLQSKFENTKVEMIENARHELFNESADLRNEAFRKITEYLENKI